MDQDAGALSRGIPDSQTEAGVGGCSFLSLCWHQGNFVWVMKEKKRKVLHFFLCSEWMFCTISSSCSQRHLSDYFSALHSAEQLCHDTTEPWTMSRYQPALLLWQGRSGSSLSSGAWILRTLRLSQWATAWGWRYPMGPQGQVGAATDISSKTGLHQLLQQSLCSDSAGLLLGKNNLPWICK